MNITGKSYSSVSEMIQGTADPEFAEWYERRKNRTVTQVIIDWCQETSQCDENQFVRRLREKGLSDENILVALEELDETCHHCFNGDKSCTCMRDE